MSTKSPLVACILPTYNRRAFLSHAINYFLREDYPDCELIIIDDGSDAVQGPVPGDPRIRYTRLTQIGAKRNFACREARGSIMRHSVDDELDTFQRNELLPHKTNGWPSLAAKIHFEQPKPPKKTRHCSRYCELSTRGGARPGTRRSQRKFRDSNLSRQSERHDLPFRNSLLLLA